MAAARDVSTKEPEKAFELEHGRGKETAGDRRQDRHRCRQDGFQKIADPYLDKLAKDLGPHADKIKNLIRAIN